MQNKHKRTNKASDQGSETVATRPCSTRPQSLCFRDPSGRPAGSLGVIGSLILVSWSACPETPCRRAWTVAEYTCFQKSVRGRQELSAKDPGSRTCHVPSLLRSAGRGGHSHITQCFISVSATLTDHTVQGPSKDKAHLWKSQTASGT